MPVQIKSNNFDLLRLGLALVVCVMHAAELSQSPAFAPLAHVLSAAVAIKAFFVVSGFLIFMSYEQSLDVRTYFFRRGRRIYPAYCAVVIGCALLLFFDSSRSATEYFSPALLEYVVANLLFLNAAQPSLPGVFEHGYSTAVNGALWTLKIEILFYAVVPLLAHAFRRWGRLRMLALVYLGSIGYTLTMNALAARTGQPVYAQLGRQLPGQLSYFMAGAAVYYYFPFFQRHIKKIVPAAIAAYGAATVLPIGAVAPAALACLVLAVALFTPPVRLFEGDYSYGIYIVHYPVVQLLLEHGGLNRGPWIFLVGAVAAAGAGAFLMWELVERRFIRPTTPSQGRRALPDAAVSAQPAPGR